MLLPASLQQHLFNAGFEKELIQQSIYSIYGTEPNYFLWIDVSQHQINANLKLSFLYLQEALVCMSQDQKDTQTRISYNQTIPTILTFYAQLRSIFLLPFI